MTQRVIVLDPVGEPPREEALPNDVLLDWLIDQEPSRSTSERITIFVLDEEGRRVQVVCRLLLWCQR